MEDFFTTMFVSVTCLALEGYILITSNLHALLNNEVQMTYDYGDMVYYSLANELKATPAATSYSSGSKEHLSATNMINQVASAININNINQKIPFSILGDNGDIVFSSLAQTFDKKIISLLGEQQKGWALKKINNGIYIQAIRPALYQNNILY